MTIFDVFFVIAMFEIYVDGGGAVAYTYATAYIILGTSMAIAEWFTD